MKKLYHTISTIFLGLILAACNQSAVHIDWVDFIQFGEIQYLTTDFGGGNAGRPLRDADLGPEFAKVRFKHAEEHLFGHECCRDGDAAFLEAGTPVYTVKGYQPKFRLAAQRDGRWVLYEADTNPKAKTGADLLDISGKVEYIGVNSAQDGVTELAAITDPEQVAGLVELVLSAPVDQNYQAQGDSQLRYFIAFYMKDGTIVNRAYWPSSGELSRGILLPDEFRVSVEQALVAATPGPTQKERYWLLENDKFLLAYSSFALSQLS